jgi:hypothetical protein
MIVEKYAFVLLLLLNEESNLFSQIVDRFVELFVDPVRQTSYQCQPYLPSHSRARLANEPEAGKGFRLNET